MTSSARQRSAIIIGAGPGGLTAAYELLQKTDIRPVIFEMSEDVGGLSRTVLYRGNRIDIGGHRFFSKHPDIMEWWRNILPLAAVPDDGSCHETSFPPGYIDAPPADPETTDRVLLIRKRLSRILFRRCLIPYPVTLSLQTLSCLGPILTIRILFAYARARLFPIRPENTLEDFFINRFGRLLYGLFFRDYTEKVWGVPCAALPSSWGAQRVRGFSFWKALAHAVKSRLGTVTPDDVTLTPSFLYPKLGPGQLWEEVARRVVEQGGELHPGNRVLGIRTEGDRVTAARIREEKTGVERWVSGDYFFSTMPVKDLVAGWEEGAPEAIRNVAAGLAYRDFITVGVLLSRLRTPAAPGARPADVPLPDNWIYIQEPDVRAGRLQIYNNWSPWLVQNPDTFWLGLEYFCQEGDAFWNLADADIAAEAGRELERLGFAEEKDILDAVVLRSPKSYPSYSGTYAGFGLIRDFLDRFYNFFPIGRNGMHRYNNMDHSMLTAMRAVENISRGERAKDKLWAVNLEEDYQG